MAAVIAFDHLMFLSRIREAARGAGLEVRSVRKLPDLLAAARDGARLVLADLDTQRLPVLDGVAALRGEPDLAGLAVVGFLSHVHADRAAAGQAAGCTRVLARSAFVAQLPQLLAEAALFPARPVPQQVDVELAPQLGSAWLACSCSSSSACTTVGTLADRLKGSAPDQGQPPARHVGQVEQAVGEGVPVGAEVLGQLERARDGLEQRRVAGHVAPLEGARVEARLLQRGPQRGFLAGRQDLDARPARELRRDLPQLLARHLPSGPQRSRVNVR